MKSYFSIPLHSLAFISLVCSNLASPKLEASDGFGQLKNAPMIIPGGTDELGREYSYFGQVATEQKIILTASNGFFTKRTCTAVGESLLPKVGDDELIVPNFEHLNWKSAEGSLRWYVLVNNPGAVKFQVHMDVAGGGSDIEVQFAGQTKSVTTKALGSDQAQPWDLEFEVKEPGEYEINFSAKKIGGGNGVGKLFRIEAVGPAMEDANLIRVRWRPAAVHGGYDTKKVSGVRLLVFTTRSIAKISSYSPITTPFGYYGTTFDNDGRSGGGLNFSMWGNEKGATDLKIMPHLLGVGSPIGEFSGFGHEGSGVKPRGWDPMPDKPELVVQALRVVSGDEYDGYFGYYFDHPTKTWKLFGAGNKWHGGKPKDHLKLGSFCEVPGPPQSERTGDVYREVQRNGWAYDEGKWVPLEIFNAGGSGSKGDQPVNKSWYTTKDGAYAMGCGGIRLYTHKSAYVTSGGSDELPYFLKIPSIENVFTMPISYGDIQVSEVAADLATIEFDIAKGGDLKSGAIYFGTSDSLTFAPRELHGTEKKSELSKAVKDSSWQEMVELDSVQQGVNQIVLKDLKPETTYYYRILTNNAESRVWSDKTFQFTTEKSGAALVTQSPLAAANQNQLTDEPVRKWTYAVNGKQRIIEGRLTEISAGSVQIERSSDGKSGKMSIRMLSDEDKKYVESKR